MHDLVARCTFPAAGGLDLAVSGGADSTAMLVLAVAAGFDVTVHHVDHHIRSDAAADAAHVRSLGEVFDVPVHVWDVHVEDGPDLENRARRARRSVLPGGVQWGHTADDQAETLLLALLRGTGPDGAGAMAPTGHPLLGLRRRDTWSVCAALGIEPCRDPTNDDPRHRRNRVRAELLPLLDDIADRDVVPLLARFAELQRSLLAAIDDDMVEIDPTDARALAGLPDALAARSLRTWWRAVTGSAHAPDRAATERMLAVVRGAAPRCDVVGGWRLSRSGGRLRLEATREGPGR